MKDTGKSPEFKNFLQKMQFRFQVLPVILKILDKHRKKKDSILFLLKAIAKKQPGTKISDIIPPIFWQNIHTNPKKLERLSGIYAELEKEIGTPRAITALTEITTEIAILKAKIATGQK